MWPVTSQSPTSSVLIIAAVVCRFTDSLIKGMSGQEGVVECAYVASDVTESPFFATPLVLGPNGIEKNLGLGIHSAVEQVSVDRYLFISIL